MLRVAQIVLRFLIGGLLIATALGKALDLSGFAEVVATYHAVPAGFEWPVAVTVVLAEVALGTWLISGRALRYSALGSVVMHGGYAGLAAVTLARGIDVPNCGCFGVFFARPLTSSTVIEDSVVVLVSFLLAWLAHHALQQQEQPVPA